MLIKFKVERKVSTNCAREITSIQEQILYCVKYNDIISCLSSSQDQFNNRFSNFHKIRRSPFAHTRKSPYVVDSSEVPKIRGDHH